MVAEDCAGSISLSSLPVPQIYAGVGLTASADWSVAIR